MVEHREERTLLFYQVAAKAVTSHTYLFVELDVGGLELLLDVILGEVVGELVVRVAHTRSVFSGRVVGDSGLGHCVESYSLVLRVPDFVQVHMRDLLVRDIRWVVRWRVPRKLGEVLGCHGEFVFDQSVNQLLILLAS